MTSRRPNPAADKAAQNQQVIKSLLKLPGNKHCADCKRNAHPRWASWNLGIFICIRCSGIHRGMGTHISRVKSVDLDTWTEEQLQSMLRWGNSRANKYWEAKLADGHVPSESKIENFVRTKYESKRWVMEGGMPDPSTLADSDEDDTPLRVVQEKNKAEAAKSSSAPQKPVPAPPPTNLFDDSPASFSSPVVSPPSVTSQVLKKVTLAPPKQTKPADSLLGLDFFAPSPSVSPRPSSDYSNTAATGGSSRPDLNRSILSLYSSAPKQAPKPQPMDTGSFSPFGAASQTQQAPSSGLGGLIDDFGGGFSGLGSSQAPPPPSQPPKPSPFANLTSGMMSSSNSGNTNRFAKPSSSNVAKPPISQAAPSAGFDNLFDLSSPASQNKPAQATFPSYTSKPAASNTMFTENAWASPQASKPNTTSPAFDWNSSSTSTTKPAITSDDDFGAFSTGGFGAPPPPANKPAPSSGGSNAKPGTFDDDLFSNVWS